MKGSDEVPADDDALLVRAIEAASHVLPEQAPLHMFVHHNTLHIFEHLPFEKAVLEASKLWGAEPYMGEDEFRRHLDSGRITREDIKQVLPDLGDDPILPGGPTRREFYIDRLTNLLALPTTQQLTYFLEERDPCATIASHVDAAEKKRLKRYARRQHPEAINPERACLAKLWARLSGVAPSRSGASRTPIRRSEQLAIVYDVDVDGSYRELLIRIAGAFVDQGIAYWQMPYREHGLLVAFRRLYGTPGLPGSRYLAGLPSELARQESEGLNVLETIGWALRELDVPKAQWSDYVQATLLSLRGWAGMIHQLELHPDKAPVEAPPARLSDFLATMLLLEVFACRNVLAEQAGRPGSFSKLEARAAAAPNEDERAHELLAYEAFLFAQSCPGAAQAILDGGKPERWLEVVRELDETERRRLLHLAFEHHHRVEVLDAMVAHVEKGQVEAPPPAFQAVFCIDDREESIRRHLEERFPHVDTFGFAGFFGVAMSYRGLDDVRPRPLCPVSITPQHLIVEEAIDNAEEDAYKARRKSVAHAELGAGVASKTMARGALAAIFGPLTAVPFVLRTALPSWAASWSSLWDHGVATRPKTRLRVDSTGKQEHGLKVGYTTDEQIEIVAGALRTMGLADRFCPIVLMVGHGSSSLNNPHEAAHDCGATGGGRGGPNARAFAAMANSAEVREGLRDRGIEIPDSTWFVGSYHNTCDDGMTYYDEDLIPAGLVSDFERVRQAMEEAAAWDAHERCRRFETTKADVPLNKAVSVARLHANDLAEPRPEYGHATNAICVVGRRERTRGLFLDRRAFLVSYDPTTDDDGQILRGLLRSVGPVGAGINLEYYFSYVDNARYGCGTKLPHNITGLVGVMDGHASDLRTGLPWQMVEIHEPVRLLTIVEASPERLASIMEQEPGVDQLVRNQWIQVVAWDPVSSKMQWFNGTRFVEHKRSASHRMAQVDFSPDYYARGRNYLAPARVVPTSAVGAGGL